MMKRSQPDPLESVRSLAWTRQESVAFDLFLQRECALPASLLMENAGAALAAATTQAALACGARRVLFLVGPGNNGGDALVASRQLQGRAELECHAEAPLGLCRTAGSPAYEAARAARAVGVQVGDGSCGPDSIRSAQLVVDGLFGVGLARAVDGKARETIQALSEAAVPTLAVDLPSGLDCDTGAILGTAVRARWTLTFVAPKAGFYRGAGPDHVGEVRTADIGVSAAFARAWLERRRSAGPISGEDDHRGAG